MTTRSRSTSLYFHSRMDGNERDSVLTPPTDVCRIPGGWLVKMELAGVKPQDVAFDFQDDVLHIHGARRDYTCEEVTGHLNMEIAYQRFFRSIKLPHKVDPAQLSVEFRDGMMLLRVKPSEENS
jgi:HSP20 family protein